MTLHQKIFSIIISVVLFGIIIGLVRDRKLRMEYSWIWFLTGCLVIMLVVWYELLVIVTALIGAVAPTTTLFIFSTLFLVFIALQFAIKISRMSTNQKNLAQKISLLEAKIDQASH